LAECEANGEEFTDPDFPPSNDSLCVPEDWKDKFGDCEWVRSYKIPSCTNEDGDNFIFSGGIVPDDIKQGNLGDCYFLSVLSILAERPVRIENLFINHEVNDSGVFGLRIIKNG
jgi:calpain-15